MLFWFCDEWIHFQLKFHKPLLKQLSYTILLLLLLLLFSPKVFVEFWNILFPACPKMFTSRLYLVWIELNLYLLTQFCFVELSRSTILSKIQQSTSYYRYISNLFECNKCFAYVALYRNWWTRLYLFYILIKVLLNKSDWVFISL